MVKEESMSVENRTLLLSQGYEPIKVISWRRAIALLTLGKVEVVEEYGDELRAVSLVIKMPAVVRLLRAFRRHRGVVKFSRVNIAARDGYRCQYCAVKCKLGDLTYDHVLPRSRGGATSWDNIVSACVACNSRKANRTPMEAGMKLDKKPVQPAWMSAVIVTVSNQSVPDAWRDYMYWTGELSR
jgi:5-methylcytosine-specific restriction endonuclease McrA